MAYFYYYGAAENQRKNRPKGNDSQFFFVAKNVLWKKATYITNIGHTSEMKGFLNEALFGVFKTNLTRYMSSLFNEKLFKSLAYFYYQKVLSWYSGKPR